MRLGGDEWQHVNAAAAPLIASFCFLLENLFHILLCSEINNLLSSSDNMAEEIWHVVVRLGEF